MTIGRRRTVCLGQRARPRVLVVLLGLLVVPLSPAGATFPGADGRVVFSRGGDLWTAAVGPSSYSERRLTFDGVTRNARWSADGTRIVFNTRAGNIGVMSATGTNSRTLVSGRSYQPTWSPPLTGGQAIAFVRVPLGMPGDIWRVPAAGGRAFRLTHDGAANCGNAWPSWSSTGIHVAYVRYGTGLDGECRTHDDTKRLVVLDLATKRRFVVPDAAPDGTTYPISGRPDFRPDGTKVQYMTAGSCEEVVLNYDVSTREISELATNYSCEGGSQLIESQPTPSDGIASLSSYTSNDEDIPGMCLRVPAGEKCIDGSGAAWSSIHVQPRP